MARNLEKVYEANYRWEKNNTYRISLRIINNSEVADALEKCTQAGNIKTAYAMTALREKLIRDGSLNPENIE